MGRTWEEREQDPMCQCSQEQWSPCSSHVVIMDDEWHHDNHNSLQAWAAHNPEGYNERTAEKKDPQQKVA
jgi:hypothetical protein